MSPTDTRTPVQKRSIQKKQSIKEAALLLFSEKGYHGTSSNEIAKKAGVSIGTFYSYYSNKKDLFYELTMKYYDNVLKDIPEIPFDDDTNPRSIIKKYIKIVATGHEYMPDFHKIINILAESDEEFKAFYDECDNKIGEKIFQLFANNIHLSRVKNLEVAIFVIKNSLEAVIHATKLHPCRLDEEEILDQLTDMICRYVFADTVQTETSK